MASSTDMYYQISSDGGDSQHAAGARMSKVGATLIGGGAFIMVLSMVALSFSTSSVEHKFADESTDLVSMPTLRASSLKGIGGPSPWKQLAIDAINVNNRCDRDRDLSMRALLTDFAKKYPESITVLAEAAVQAENKAKSLPGAIEPLGFWDPWGLSTEAGEDTIAYYREAELKHGRTCMLAYVGIMVGEKLHPFNGPAEVDILGMPTVESAPLTTIFASIVLSLIGLAELKSAARIQGLMSGEKGVVAGDLGFDPFNMKPKNERELLELQNKELANGRLAMLAVAGAIAQEQVTLQKIFR